jgi:hypothetical protein
LANSGEAAPIAADLYYARREAIAADPNLISFPFLWASAFRESRR